MPAWIVLETTKGIAAFRRSVPLVTLEKSGRDVGDPLEATLDAARRLTKIGHSSGWDMLAGFVAAILGTTAITA